MPSTFSPAMVENGIKATLVRRLGSLDNWVPQIAFMETSDGESEKHEGLDAPPAMVEIDSADPQVAGKGALQAKSLGGSFVEIFNSTFASAVSLKRRHFDDNRSGTARRRIAQLSDRAVNHPMKLFTDLIVNNTAVDLYGEVMFANSHDDRGGGGNTDNLLVGSGTSASQVATDLGLAKAALLGMRDAGKDPFHGNGAGVRFVAMVPPQLEKPAREALEAGQIGDTSNVQAGMASLIVNPHLYSNDANDFYLFAVSEIARPVIWQAREMPTVETLAEGSSAWFFDEDAHFKVRYRAGIGVGHWQAAVKVVNT